MEEQRPQDPVSKLSISGFTPVFVHTTPLQDDLAAFSP